MPSTVLIVDDTPANLAVVFEALSASGHRVLVAESGAAALNLVREVVPDLVLLDVRMPGLDGFATCSRLRALPGAADVPVLFLTAVDDPEQKVRAFEFGARDYITKPVHVPELLARVETHLHLRALQRSLEAKNAELEEEIALRAEAENQLGKLLDSPVLAASREGRIRFATQEALRRIARVFGETPEGQLPAALAALAAGPARGPVPCQGLDVRILRDSPDSDLAILFLEDTPGSPDPARLSVLGVTDREAHVLFWLAQGKSNPEIATILGSSVRTIHKHMEHIFQKLGVENRTAAMLSALEVLRKA